MVNPLSAGASGTGQRLITGEGEHGGFGVRIAGAANSPFEQHGKQATATPLLPPCTGWGLGCRSLQALPYPAGTVAAHDVSCWHNCNTPKLHHCSWPPLGPPGSTSYVLNFW